MSALDVFMKSDLKARLVVTPRLPDGRPNLGEDRRLSKIAFESLSIGEQAVFLTEADRMNDQMVGGDPQLDAESRAAHRRAL